MLASLHVSNYAIIDEVKLDFDKGFNVITGETGAGKSILLGALGLILGERADTRVLYDEQRKCIVHAQFHLNSVQFSQLPRSDEYDISEQLSLRREISNTGKSRAYINDTPVRLGTLKDLASTLIDIHNQFDTLAITQPDYQLRVLDAFAQNQGASKQYKEHFFTYQQLSTELHKIMRAKESIQKDHEYYLFQLEELEKISLDQIDELAINHEYNALVNADGIKELTQLISAELTDNDMSVESRLISLNKSLQRYADINSDLKVLAEIMEELLDQTRAAEKIARRQQDSLDTSEERMMELKEQLDEINRLEKKHGVSELSALIAIRDELRIKTEGRENLDRLIQEKKKELVKAQDLMEASAQALSESRLLAAKPLGNEIEKRLYDLAIPHGKVAFDIDKLAPSDESGADLLTLKFSANRGQALHPISGIASGGELSRLALSVKAIIASQVNVPTLLFDEIDTGISGAVALRLGNILSSIAQERQVICITHSPQVAAVMGRHFSVNKIDRADRTVTSVKTLGSDDRVVEIAKMLSADPPSESALSNARELLAMQ